MTQKSKYQYLLIGRLTWTLDNPLSPHLEILVRLFTESCDGLRLIKKYFPPGDKMLWGVNECAGSAGGNSLPLLLRKPGRKALLWPPRLPGGRYTPKWSRHRISPRWKWFTILMPERRNWKDDSLRWESQLDLPSSSPWCCSPTSLRETSLSLWVTSILTSRDTAQTDE